MSKLNNKGITLLEALIAMTVILIGILVLTRLFPVALQLSKSAEQVTIATNLSQAKIEEMFYLDFNGITIGTIEAREKLSTNSSNPFYHYERETEAEYVDENLNTSVAVTELKKVTVTTYWKSSLFALDKDVELNIIIVDK